jgi:uncharacterized protein YndB with AHSA1/START domain
MSIFGKFSRRGNHMAAEKNRPVESSDRELVLTRVFDAPRALVYRMWTEIEHLTRWSAPVGYTLIHNEGDLRPGGKWRSCMRSPEGQDLWLGGTYREVVPDRSLMFTHAWDQSDGLPGRETLVTVLLEDHGRGTKMTFRQAFFESVQQRDGHLGGWTQCFDRLDAYLEAPR